MEERKKNIRTMKWTPRPVPTFVALSASFITSKPWYWKNNRLSFRQRNGFASCEWLTGSAFHGISSGVSRIGQVIGFGIGRSFSFSHSQFFFLPLRVVSKFRRISTWEEIARFYCL